MKDLFGTHVTVGDAVAYARTTSGNTPFLAIGTVTGTTGDGTVCTIGKTYIRRANQVIRITDRIERTTEEKDGTMDDFLDTVETLMDEGLDEDTACREAYALTNPDAYDPEDYE